AAPPASSRPFPQPGPSQRSPSSSTCLCVVCRHLPNSFADERKKDGETRWSNELLCLADAGFRTLRRDRSAISKRRRDGPIDVRAPRHVLKIRLRPADLLVLGGDLIRQDVEISDLRLAPLRQRRKCLLDPREMLLGEKEVDGGLIAEA